MWIRNKLSCLSVKKNHKIEFGVTSQDTLKWGFVFIYWGKFFEETKSFTKLKMHCTICLSLMGLKKSHSELQTFKVRIFWEISTLLLSTVHTDKSKVEVLQNFVAFSQIMKFKSTFKLVKKIDQYTRTRLGILSKLKC